MYTQPHYDKHGRDDMGWFIVEDGLSCMMPKPNMQAVGEAKSKAKSTSQKRTEKQENAEKAADKVQTKAVMDAKRQGRRRSKRKFLLGLSSSRRPAMSETAHRKVWRETEAARKAFRGTRAQARSTATRGQVDKGAMLPQVRQQERDRSTLP